MYMVFVSHSSKDEDIAEEIVDILEHNDIKCWVAPRDVMGGMPYAEEIVNAIKMCKVLFLLASDAINKSEQVLNEIEIAVNNSKLILPFKIDSSVYNDSYKYYLNRKHWINALPDPASHYGEMIKTVKYLLNKENNDLDTQDDQYLISLSEKNKRELIRKTSEKRLSFGLSIEDDNFLDNEHFYEEIKRFDVVDKKTGMYSSCRWLKIKNVTDHSTNFIYHKECGENKVNFKDINIKAKTVEDNPKKLIIESLTQIQPNFIQVVKIHFYCPLEPNQSVTIFYKLDWPGESLAYFDGEMSTSISLTRYKKGVGHLIFGIMRNEQLYGFEIEEVCKNFTTKNINLTPKLIHCRELSDVKFLREKNYAGFYYDIPDAKDNASYRIIYKVIESNNKEDDEDDDI